MFIPVNFVISVITEQTKWRPVMTDAMVIRNPNAEINTEGPGRAIGAWFVAALAAAAILYVVWAGEGVLGAAPSAQNWLGFLSGFIPGTLFMAFFVVLLTAIPWTMLVWAMRLTRVQRGFGDVFAGALMGGGLIQIFGMPLIYGGTGLTTIFAIAGAVGGFTYWLIARRPK
jgi:hypothetical protein